jgi:hypothetical protein
MIGGLASAACGTSSSSPCESQGLAVIPADPNSGRYLHLENFGVGPARLLAWQSAYIRVDPVGSWATVTHLWHIDVDRTVIEWAGMPTPCFPGCQNETKLSAIAVDADRVALGWAWTPSFLDYRVGVSVWQPTGSSFWELPSPSPYPRAVPEYERVGWGNDVVLATWFDTNDADFQRPNLVMGAFTTDGAPVGAPVLVVEAVDTVAAGNNHRLRIVATGATDPMAHVIVQMDSNTVSLLPVSEGPTLGVAQTLGEPGDRFVDAVAGPDGPEVAVCRDSDLIVIAGADSWRVPQGCFDAPRLTARLAILDGVRWVSWTEDDVTRFARLGDVTETFECEIPAASSVFARLDGTSTIEWLDGLTLRALALDEL